jgi:ribosomal protein L7Ae-like RNA K-turn-binding protein
MISQRILSLMGITKKANKLVSGQDVVERQIKANKIYLVILSKDATYNTKKKFNSMCVKNNIPIIFWGKSEELSKAIGKESSKVFGIIDEGFARELRKQIDIFNGGGVY